MSNEKHEKRLSEIAQRIKSRRLDLGYSYQDIATLTGISKSTLQRYETGGIANLPVEKIDALAVALETSADYLLGWKKKPALEASISDETRKLIQVIEKSDDAALKSKLNDLMETLAYIFNLNERLTLLCYQNNISKDRLKALVMQVSAHTYSVSQSRNRIEKNISDIIDIIVANGHKKMSELMDAYEQNVD